MMARIPAWRRYARFFGVDVRSDVDDELQFHLEEKTRDLIAHGMTPDAARAEAQRQFGDTAEVRQLCQTLGTSRARTLERRDYWTGWWQDVRYATRMLRTTPLVSAIAILSIALGIGANTAIFTLLDQILFRKLSVPEPDRIVRVSTEGFYYGGSIGTGRELSYPIYTELRDRNQAFTGLFALFPFRPAVHSGGRNETAEVMAGELVTGNYFRSLGIGAIRGRVIGEDDDRVPGGHPVVVISYTYWQRRLEGDPNIVGRAISISNQPMTIIGVLEPGFDGMNLASATQVFVPLMMEGLMIPPNPRMEARGLRWLKAYARLKPGITPEQAEASLAPLYRTLREQDLTDARFSRASATVKQRYLNENQIDIIPASEGYTPMRGEWREPLWMLMAIVAGVLLIACANVANLLLARGASRQREVALRLSLGATRGRIVRQMLVESVMLAAAGGVAGLLLARAGAQMLVNFMSDPETVSRISATPDMRVLMFTGTIAIMTGLLFGMIPAFQSTKPALAPTLKDLAGSVVGGGHVRVRKALVVSQVALSLLLLIGAGLFLRSLNGLMTLDLGFKREHLLTFGADPTQAGYQGVRVKQYAMDLLSKVRATPGVEAAGFSRLGVLFGGAWGNSLTVEGYQAKEDEIVFSRLNSVSPGYFEAMGIPLLMGRDFTEADYRALGPSDARDDKNEGYRVAIVSEAFAKRFITGHPLGRHIAMGNDPGTPTTIEIVGVVKDSTYTWPGEELRRTIYFPYLESRDANSAWFYVRTAQDPEAMLETMRRTMRELDPNVPPLQLKTMETQVRRSLVNQRLMTGLSAVFSLLATLLAMVGLYGVMTYGVTRRTREIGVRMALGAVAPRVIWLILREALLLIACGVAIALPAAWWLSGFVRSELHGVTGTDPLTVVAAVTALIVVAMTAGMIPAMRAAHIDPIRALRQE
jgi:predicted permease